MRSPVGRWGLAAALLGGALAVTVAESPTQAATASVTCAAVPPGPPATTPTLPSYTAINPTRLVDTRNNIGGVGAPLDAGCTLRMNVAGDVPADASAISLSMTAVSNGRDYFTVYPCASGRPETSNLNSRAGIATPNLVVAIPDSNRDVCIFSHGPSHLIVDLAGWWTADGPDRFGSIPPQRVLDTRQPGGSRLSPFVIREVAIPATVVPAGSTAAVINLTVDGASAAGYMTVFPCGNPTPPSSNLNFVAREARAVAAIVGLGSGGTLCVFSDVSTNVIVDVNGYYAPAPTFSPTADLQPRTGTRIIDTRNGIGGPRAPFARGETRQIDPVALAGAAPETTSVLLNVVATNPRGDGFLTIYQCDATRPEVSSLNFTAPTEATNLAAIELAADRTICIFSSEPTEVIVDLFGVAALPSGSLAAEITIDKPAWPSYLPTAPDFAIVCNAGTTNVSVSLDLFPGVAAAIDGQPATGTVTRALQNDQVMTLTLQRDGTTLTHHFRCLPSDFPTLAVNRPGAPSPGWYLTTFGMAGSPLPGYAVIFDHFGAPVWYKRTSQPILDLKKLGNGSLVATPQLGQAFGFQPANGYWNFQLNGTFNGQLLTVTPAQFPTDQHDFIELPDGGRTLLSYPLVNNVNLTPLNGTLNGQCGPLTPDTCPFVANDRIVDGVIQEIDAGGNLLWDWRATEHFDNREATFPNRFTVPLYPGPRGVVDLHHLNAIDRQPDGDYVVTARHMDNVFRIDRTSGEVEWILGGRSDVTNPDGATRLQILGDPTGGPKRPHDARLAGDVLTMMDNQTSTGQPSRAVAYRIDPAAGTATLLWQIQAPSGQSGGTLGSTRVAPDGSVLVGWGAPLQPMFTEYDANRKLVMSMVQFPFGYSYRIVKYAPGEFDVNQLRANAGGATVGP